MSDLFMPGPLVTDQPANGSAGLPTSPLDKEGGGVRNLYLDLMKSCLINSIYGESELAPVSGGGFLRNGLLDLFAKCGLYIARKRYNPHIREAGLDWPPIAHTMIGLKRLNNLQCCIEDVLAKGVPGDLIETGVWRGGATIFMRAVLKASGIRDRVVWVADSFEGLPEPDSQRFPADNGDLHHMYRHLAVSVGQVRANFLRYGLLDDQVRFLCGWFRDTLPDAPIDRLAIMRLDGDMYESTMDALISLYPKLSKGGYVIVDDYGAVSGCQRAVHDYRKAHGITDPIVEIDWTGVFWRKL